MTGQVGLGERPEGIRLRFRAGDEILQAFVFLPVEMVDVHELLRRGIAAEGGPVGDHLGREVGADAGQRLEGGAVGPVDVDAGNVDVGREAVEYRIGDHIGFGEIGRPAEAAALGPVVQDGQSWEARHTGG
jgi:hypothetical protein